MNNLILYAGGRSAGRTNLNLSWLKLQIINSLATITDQSVFAAAIRNNPAASIDMIYDQAKDNRELVAGIVGEETLRMIEGYKSS